MRHRNASGVRLLPGVRLARLTAMSSALFHTYLPALVLLRDILRLTVEGETPTICVSNKRNYWGLISSI